MRACFKGTPTGGKQTPQRRKPYVRRKPGSLFIKHLVRRTGDLKKS